MKDSDFIGTEWLQHCGDTLVVIKKSSKGGGLWVCNFKKYPFIKEFRKDVILKGEARNPQIEIEEFKNKIWKQNCGDSLRVIKKTDIYKNNEYLWEVEFIKYPFLLLGTKGNIIKGTILNPRIEEEEFIKKEWPQNCGDTLKILEKTEKKIGSALLFKCQFIKFPNIVYKTKAEIKSGRCFNNLLNEIQAGKIFQQNCGDSIKVLKKIEGRKGLYECEFQKYPFKVLKTKKEILEGRCLNPLIEQKEFIEKFWIQKGEEKLRVLNKTLNKKGYWDCLFIDTNTKIQADKRSIIQGIVVNPLHKYISLGEKELKEYISSIFDKEIIFGTWKILSNYELDIYIPSLQMAFEFNGIYWHSQKFKDKNYHLDKLKLCNDKQIALYYIWEDEWRDKREEIKNWLKELILNNNNISQEKDKLGWYDNNMIPKLIQRDKFYCWNCG